ncbi:MAG: hypothetical protein NUV57_01480 [archaeon]|nr:hypothetical protein [archaeon]
MAKNDVKVLTELKQFEQKNMKNPAKKKKYTIQQKKEIKKFSYALVLLKLTTMILFLTLILVLGIQLKTISINQGLIILLGALVGVYFALPFMAVKVFDGVVAFTSKKRYSK